LIIQNILGWCDHVRQALRTRYVRLLEEELARGRGETERLREEIAALRSENRAVINSLLGTAGVPPIETPRAFVTTPAVRRRSWSQIATTREIEAARAERASRGRLRDEVPGKGGLDDDQVHPALYPRGLQVQPGPEREREKQASRTGPEAL
jgi:hypothetical protein